MHHSDYDNATLKQTVDNSEGETSKEKAAETMGVSGPSPWPGDNRAHSSLDFVEEL